MRDKLAAEERIHGTIYETKVQHYSCRYGAEHHQRRFPR